MKDWRTQILEKNIPQTGIFKTETNTNTMRIENIANELSSQFYELTIFGTESELENFADFTKFTADFIEEELHNEYSITIISKGVYFNKKEFRAELTEELKAFRKQK